jgi:L-ribulose-5-phosphate 4-epimerase
MGLGFIHMAHLFGAGRVIASDFSAWRRDKARELGATDTLDASLDDLPAALRAINDGLLADVVVATAPTVAAWADAVALVEKGGTIHLGAPGRPGSEWVLDGAEQYFSEVTITSKYSATTGTPTSSCGCSPPGRSIPARHHPPPAPVGAACGLRAAGRGGGVPEDRALPRRRGPRREVPEMMLESLRDEVLVMNHELPRNGLVVWSGGNVSGRDPDTGLIVIKPSGIPFQHLTAESLVVVDLDGTVVEGDLKPSVDLGVHLHVYQSPRRRDGHVPHPLAVRHQLRGARGEHPGDADAPDPSDRRWGPVLALRHPGAEDTGAAVMEVAGDTGMATLVDRHGVFTMGRSASESVKVALHVEEAAMTIRMAHDVGPVTEMDPDEIERCAAWYRGNYGQ